MATRERRATPRLPAVLPLHRTHARRARARTGNGCLPSAARQVADDAERADESRRHSGKVSSRPSLVAAAEQFSWKALRSEIAEAMGRETMHLLRSPIEKRQCRVRRRSTNGGTQCI